MENFVYNTPSKVFFGKGEENNVGKIIKSYGAKKVLVHYGGGSAEKSGLLERIRKNLQAENIHFVELGGVKPNPELSLVRRGIELCLAENVDFVLAVGGGSVLDSAKDIANGAACPDVDVWDFSLGKKVPEKSLKKGAVLTLAAAGSEMSDSCVITNSDSMEKRGYSCSCNRMDFAIENPELTFSVSPYQTACGIVDICMHTMERYFCIGSDTVLTDGIAEHLIKTTIKSGLECLDNPCNYEARANMMWASSLSHNGLTGCGRKFILPVHQMEHEVSGFYPDVAHGAGLAALWCSWARYVYASNIQRWLQYSSRVWNVDIDFEHPEKTIEKAIDLQEELYRKIGMPVNLKSLGVKKDDLNKMTDGCTRNRSRNLPGYKTLEYGDILAIYEAAFE